MIYIGADHAGFKLKEELKKFLKKKNMQFKDLGNLKHDINDDYPDWAAKVGRAVVKSKNNKGILLCGSAEGVGIAANKIRGVRAAVVTTLKNAKRSRLHDDANILCLAGGETLHPVGGVSLKKARRIVDIWLNTPFSGEKRHIRRIAKIRRLEDESIR